MAQFIQKQIVTAGDMSATINGAAIDLDQIYGFSVQAIWSGTPTGTLGLQFSNDIAQGGAAPTNWTADSTQALSGSAGSYMWNIWPANYRWVRLVYTKTSGTGTLNATYVGKA